jgi:hypothetical protein
MRSKQKLENLYHYCAQHAITLDFSRDTLTDASNSCKKRTIYFSTNDYEYLQWIVLGHEIGHIESDSDFNYVKYSIDDSYAMELEVRASKKAYKLFEELGFIEDDIVANLIGKALETALCTYAHCIESQEFHGELSALNKFLCEYESKTMLNKETTVSSNVEAMDKMMQAEINRKISSDQLKRRNKDVTILG